MRLFSLFQNLNLGNASANPKWHLAISWTTSCQYQCVCKMLSKYSKQFKSYRHYSRTGRRQNLHKQAGVKIFTNCPVKKNKCLIIGHSVKFNFKFQLTFLGSCNYKLYHTVSFNHLEGKSIVPDQVSPDGLNENEIRWTDWRLHSNTIDSDGESKECFLFSA